MLNFDPSLHQTPYYIVDESLLVRNLEILKSVADESGAKILLAQKAFSMFSVYPLISRYLSGSCASGLFEARLGYEHMGGETHVFCPGYNERDIDELLSICDHLVFNSFGQWERFKDKAVKSGKSCGIRINPQHSTQTHGIYDPCSPGSRLGVTIENFRDKDLTGISGLHFHTLCEQDSDALEETLVAVERDFGPYLHQMKWINFGGGHHITQEDYDIPRLIRLIKSFREKYGLTVYLEPGEAIALNAGFLVTSVVDTIKNGMDIAILDTSAACHMPDVLEMPYRPRIIGADGDDCEYTFRLGGPTCLAGDIIGDYRFRKPLEIGDRLIFCDMAIYSMVKNNTFNGMNLPSIALWSKEEGSRIIKSFGYQDFKMRLS